MEETIVRQIQEHAQPVSIEVERGQKGNYGWSIKARGATVEECIEQIVRADARLRLTYCEVELPQK